MLSSTSQRAAMDLEVAVPWREGTDNAVHARSRAGLRGKFTREVRVSKGHPDARLPCRILIRRHNSGTGTTEPK